MLSPVYVAELN